MDAPEHDPFPAICKLPKAKIASGMCTTKWCPQPSPPLPLLHGDSCSTGSQRCLWFSITAFPAYELCQTISVCSCLSNEWSSCVMSSVRHTFWFLSNTVLLNTWCNQCPRFFVPCVTCLASSKQMKPESELQVSDLPHWSMHGWKTMHLMSIQLVLTHCVGCFQSRLHRVWVGPKPLRTAAAAWGIKP